MTKKEESIQKGFQRVFQFISQSLILRIFYDSFQNLCHIYDWQTVQLV